MEIKEWLKRGYEINKKIDLLLEEQAVAKAQAMSCTSIVKDTPSSSTKGNTQENKLVTYLDLDKKINNKTDELLLVKEEILAAINLLDNQKFKVLLENRHINLMTWKGISQFDELKEHNESYIQRGLYNSAVKAIKTIYSIFKNNT